MGTFTSPVVLVGPLSRYSKQPKTPLIAGIICGIVIGTAWIISLTSYILKRLRKRRRNRARRQANASTASGVPNGTSRSKASAAPRNTINDTTFATQPTVVIQTAGTTPTSDSASTKHGRNVNQLARSVSRDSGNVSVNSNTLHASTEAHNPYSPPIQKSLPPTPTSTVPSPIAAKRVSVPHSTASWVPDSIWKKPAPQRSNTRPTNDSYSLSSFKTAEDVSHHENIHA